MNKHRFIFKLNFFCAVHGKKNLLLLNEIDKKKKNKKKINDS